jgi:hypothetical protein
VARWGGVHALWAGLLIAIHWSRAQAPPRVPNPALSVRWRRRLIMGAQHRGGCARPGIVAHSVTARQ